MLLPSTLGNDMIKAVQQFQLGTVLNNEAQAVTTLQAMKAAGYTGIELCDFMIHPTPLVVKLLTKASGMPVGNGGKLDWPRIIQECGMAVPGIHSYLDTVEKDPDAAIVQCNTFGADKLVITGMYRFDYMKKENVFSLADRLNRAGEILAKGGIALLYHNHNAEFLQVAQGLSAYHLLQRETDAAFVNFEFDSYWCADAGQDPLREMEWLGSRMKLWHINDRGCRKPGFTPIYKMDSMELGYGTMELAAMAQQAKKNGIDAVILESHRNWIDGDPVKSLQRSAEFLNQHF